MLYLVVLVCKLYKKWYCIHGIIFQKLRSLETHFQESSKRCCEICSLLIEERLGNSRKPQKGSEKGNTGDLWLCRATVLRAASGFSLGLAGCSENSTYLVGLQNVCTWNRGYGIRGTAWVLDHRVHKSPGLPRGNRLPREAGRPEWEDESPVGAIPGIWLLS